MSSIHVRNRSRLGRTIQQAAFLSFLFAACGGEAKLELEDPPDIVLVTIDSLRFDRLGCYGGTPDVSPRIDSLAAGGVRFETAVSTTSWTLPAHAALFTGLYDSAHGLVDNGLSLGDEHRTLAEHLRASGYRTLGFYGGPYLHEGFGLAQGFERWQSCMTVFGEAPSAATVVRESHQPESASHADITSPRTVAEVQAALAEVGDQPLFLFVHLWDVHYDYIPPLHALSQSAREYDGWVSGRDFMGDERIAPGMAPEHERQVNELYDGEIRSVDQAFGELWDALARERDVENLLIVLTADHGEEFFEHGWKGHQRTLFDEVVLVPLIISWPKRFEPRVVERQVRLIDVLPTCLAQLGLETGPISGRDLGPLLSGEELPPAPALIELLVDGGLLRGVRTEGGKLLDTGSSASARWYDLQSDPAEADGRAADPGTAAFDELLRAKRRELEGAFRLRRSLQEPVVPFGAPDEIEARLEALGYVGSDG